MAGSQCRAVRARLRWSSVRDAVLLGVTDADGTLRFDWQKGSDFVVVAEKDGYSPAGAPLSKAVSIALQPTPGVLFTCRSETGEPIAGAMIAVSRRPIPALEDLPADACFGGHGDESLVIARTDAAGRASMPVPVVGIYWYAAHHPAYFSSVDGGVSMFDCSLQRQVDVVLGDLWVAGVQFEGPGEVVSARFSTIAAVASGRASKAGRDRLARLSAEWPRALHASATWSDLHEDRFAVLSAYHTVLGWVVEEVPYQRVSGYVPMFLAAEGEPLPQGVVQLKWEGPAGEDVPVFSAMLHSGGRSGPPIPEDQIRHLDERLHRYLELNKPLGHGPIKVPPGRYDVVVGDGLARSSLIAPLDPVDIAAGDDRTIVMKLKWRLAPLRLSVEAEPGLAWERATVSISVDGVILHSQAFHRTAAWNGLPEPSVPVGIPFEVSVKSPHCAPSSLTVLLDDPETPVVVPLRR